MGVCKMLNSNGTRMLRFRGTGKFAGCGTAASLSGIRIAELGSIRAQRWRGPSDIMMGERLEIQMNLRSEIPRDKIQNWTSKQIRRNADKTLRKQFQIIKTLNFATENVNLRTFTSQFYFFKTPRWSWACQLLQQNPLARTFCKINSNF